MKITGNCSHSVNVITFGLAQSEHIEWPLLYIEKLNMHKTLS